MSTFDDFIASSPSRGWWAIPAMMGVCILGLLPVLAMEKDVVATGNGQVVYEDGVAPVSADSSGLVKAAPPFKEYDRVEKGQVLLELNDATEVSDVGQIEAQIMRTQADIDRLQKKLPYQSVMTEGSRKLIKRGFTSGYENASTEQAMIEMQAALRQSQADLAGLQAKLVGAKDLLRRKTLVAPVSGQVQSLTVHEVGETVAAGTVVMIIVPDDHMVVDVQVPNDKFGFVEAGQLAQVKLDPYNYAENGTAPGRVLAVGRAGQDTKDTGMVFPVRIALDSQDFTDSIRGMKWPIRPGMTLTADITVTTRPVYHWLLAKVWPLVTETFREQR